MSNPLSRNWHRGTRWVRSRVTNDQNVWALRAEILKLKQRVYAMEATAELERAGRKPRFPIEFKSQMGEDLWIWDTLGHQSEGFYIEVGAFDGYWLSVTYALEAIGWTGLLIEALPERAEECRRRRPNSRVEHAALGRRGSKGTIQFVNVHDQEGGTLSYIATDSEHDKFIKRGGIRTETIDVPLTTMNDLLKDHTGPVDVAMIDVEGAELEVLDGFDLDKYRPRLLILEDNTHGKDPRLTNYMKAKPYVFAGWNEINQLYIREDEKAARERARV